jgi:hypothetical protein
MDYLREWRCEFAAWAVWIAALCWIASSAAAPPQAESPPSAKQEEPKAQQLGLEVEEAQREFEMMIVEKKDRVTATGSY